MEAFLLGDKGPEVFYEVQDTVVDTIQDKYYHSFIMSDHYKALIAELATEEANKGEFPAISDNLQFFILNMGVIGSVIE